MKSSFLFLSAPLFRLLLLLTQLHVLGLKRKRIRKTSATPPQQRGDSFRIQPTHTLALCVALYVAPCLCLCLCLSLLLLRYNVPSLFGPANRCPPSRIQLFREEDISQDAISTGHGQFAPRCAACFLNIALIISELKHQRCVQIIQELEKTAGEREETDRDRDRETESSKIVRALLYKAESSRQ